MAKKWTINDWNARIDRTKTVQRIGRNGIWYEYLIPINGNPFEFYNDALDVRSRKSPTSKWPNGKRPGQYQPVGDKKYFNYYQLRQNKKDVQDMIDAIVEKSNEILKEIK